MKKKWIPAFPKHISEKWNAALFTVFEIESSMLFSMTVTVEQISTSRVN